MYVMSRDEYAHAKSAILALEQINVIAKSGKDLCADPKKALLFFGKIEDICSIFVGKEDCAAKYSARREWQK